MREINISREPGAFGKFRALNLVIDGERVGRLKENSSIKVQIPDNAVELRGKVDWAYTHPFSLEKLKGGETIVFKAYFTFNLLRSLGMMSPPFRIFLK